MNFLKGIRIAVTACAISLFLFYVAVVFAGRTADFILFSPYRRILPILSSFVLATGFYLRARRAARTRSSSIRR
jgi:hypothetical protein